MCTCFEWLAVFLTTQSNFVHNEKVVEHKMSQITFVDPSAAQSRISLSRVSLSPRATSAQSAAERLASRLSASRSGSLAGSRAASASAQAVETGVLGEQTELNVSRLRQATAEQAIEQAALAETANVVAKEKLSQAKALAEQAQIVGEQAAASRSRDLRSGNTISRETLRLSKKQEELMKKSAAAAEDVRRASALAQTASRNEQRIASQAARLESAVESRVASATGSLNVAPAAVAEAEVVADSVIEAAESAAEAELAAEEAAEVVVRAASQSAMLSPVSRLLKTSGGVDVLSDADLMDIVNRNPSEAVNVRKLEQDAFHDNIIAKLKQAKAAHENALNEIKAQTLVLQSIQDGIGELVNDLENHAVENRRLKLIVEARDEFIKREANRAADIACSAAERIKTSTQLVGRPVTALPTVGEIQQAEVIAEKSRASRSGSLAASRLAAATQAAQASQASQAASLAASAAASQRASSIEALAQRLSALKNSNIL